MTTDVKLSPRERLLEAAATLTYRDGVNIGVEALRKAAGVSKRRRPRGNRRRQPDGLIAPMVTTLLDAAAMR